MPPVRPRTMRLRARSSMEGRRASAVSQGGERNEVILSVAGAARAQQFVQHQQYGAARDADVRHVERRVVPVFPVEKQEIDDMPVGQAVDHVAQRAAQNQRQRQAETRLFTVDRKSTRLNSSHVKTSYAVSCLNK